MLTSDARQNLPEEKDMTQNLKLKSIMAPATSQKQGSFIFLHVKDWGQSQRCLWHYERLLTEISIRDASLLNQIEENIVPFAFGPKELVENSSEVSENKETERIPQQSSVFLNTDTKLRFVYDKYRIVIVLDISSSIAVINPNQYCVMLHQYIPILTDFLECLVTPIQFNCFSTPIHPTYYVCVIAVGLPHSDMMMLVNTEMNSNNLNDKLKILQEKLSHLETMVVSAFMQCHAKNDRCGIGWDDLIRRALFCVMTINNTRNGGTNLLSSRGVLAQCLKHDVNISVIQTTDRLFTQSIAFGYVPDSHLLDFVCRFTNGILIDYKTLKQQKYYCMQKQLKQQQHPTPQSSSQLQSQPLSQQQQQHVQVQMQGHANVTNDSASGLTNKTNDDYNDNASVSNDISKQDNVPMSTSKSNPRSGSHLPDKWFINRTDQSFVTENLVQLCVLVRSSSLSNQIFESPVTYLLATPKREQWFVKSYKVFAPTSHIIRARTNDGFKNSQIEREINGDGPNDIVNIFHMFHEWKHGVCVEYEIKSNPQTPNYCLCNVFVISDSEFLRKLFKYFGLKKHCHKTESNDKTASNVHHFLPFEQLEKFVNEIRQSDKILGLLCSLSLVYDERQHQKAMKTTLNGKHGNGYREGGKQLGFEIAHEQQLPEILWQHILNELHVSSTKHWIDLCYVDVVCTIDPSQSWDNLLLKSVMRTNWGTINDLASIKNNNTNDNNNNSSNKNVLPTNADDLLANMDGNDTTRQPIHNVTETLFSNLQHQHMLVDKSTLKLLNKQWKRFGQGLKKWASLVYFFNDNKPIDLANGQHKKEKERAKGIRTPALFLKFIQKGFIVIKWEQPTLWMACLTIGTFGENITSAQKISLEIKQSIQDWMNKTTDLYRLTVLNKTVRHLLLRGGTHENRLLMKYVSEMFIDLMLRQGLHTLIRAPDYCLLGYWAYFQDIGDRSLQRPLDGASSSATGLNECLIQIKVSPCVEGLMVELGVEPVCGRLVTLPLSSPDKQTMEKHMNNPTPYQIFGQFSTWIGTSLEHILSLVSAFFLSLGCAKNSRPNERNHLQSARINGQLITLPMQLQNNIDQLQSQPQPQSQHQQQNQQFHSLQLESQKNLLPSESRSSSSEGEEENEESVSKPKHSAFLPSSVSSKSPAQPTAGMAATAKEDLRRTQSHFFPAPINSNNNPKKKGRAALASGLSQRRKQKNKNFKPSLGVQKKKSRKDLQNIHLPHPIAEKHDVGDPSVFHMFDKNIVSSVSSDATEWFQHRMRCVSITEKELFVCAQEGILFFFKKKL
ncbi:hypothetical protein RFI_08265 [Reticulomyxa filosa]|uniref:Uncharacterized protein n=1 Tax=Reticulomyxa filosa TaxID=46433 RepID=X6NUE9_RETFI|nr:hypothetical protein RFI_08265 [Reticulomyxa filosa]|eukprot:ETO28867.1 hypothetical protein RFI_08265 [Reticulomyxa filosa]